jgi:hypothetical protein
MAKRSDVIPFQAMLNSTSFRNGQTGQGIPTGNYFRCSGNNILPGFSGPDLLFFPARWVAVNLYI